MKEKLALSLPESTPIVSVDRVGDFDKSKVYATVWDKRIWILLSAEDNKGFIFRNASDHSGGLSGFHASKMGAVRTALEHGHSVYRFDSIHEAITELEGTE